MAFDEELGKRIREALGPFKGQITEKRMFGGLCYLYNGKMSVGIVGDELCVRVVSSKYEDALKNPSARPMNFTGRDMKEFLYVSPPGFETEEALNAWIELGIEHAKANVVKLKKKKNVRKRIE